jgi:PAS domain S-box-containing protein
MMRDRKALRPSGIDILGYVPWGTHFCQFYETSQDLIEILVPYFKEGLKGNEFCMWVTSEPLQADQARAALQAAVPDLDRYIEERQIEILEYNQWYTKSGTFSTDEVLQGWVDKLNTALERGYEGLRLTGNASWLKQSNWADFTRHEETVNNVIGRYRMLAICTYSLQKCGATEILDILANHQFALLKRSGKWEIVGSAYHKKMEEALRQSEERYRALVETTPDAIVVHRDGRFLYANPAALQLYGAETFEQLKEWNILDLLHPDDRETAASRVRHVAEGGRTPLKEARAIRLDGKQIFIEANGGPIDYQGERAVQVVIHDITERKRVEEEMRQSKQLLIDSQRLIEAVTMGTEVIMATIDLDFRYTFFNTSYAKEIKRLTGKDIALGLSMLDLFEDMPEQKEIAEREWRQVLHGETTNKTLEFGDPGRYHKAYNVLHTPIKDS